MVNDNLVAFIRDMPKVELHCHLEGSIRPDTAIYMMKRNNVPGIPDHADQIHSLYRFTNLSEFVDGMKTVSNNIREIEDLIRITDELLESLIEQNVTYVEFDCAIQKYLALGHKLEHIIDAIYKQTLQSGVKDRIETRLVINLLRSMGPDAALETIEHVHELNHPFIVGIGLSGDEGKYPQHLFTHPFERAMELGMHRTVHAGEAVGPQSIWDALNLLHAERIDHGTMAIKDETLLETLTKDQIPLTQCITSNVRLNIVKDITEHPFGDFLNRGILITLNTDDPQVFNTTLTSEYMLAANTFHLTVDQLMQISRNGIKGAFLTLQSKKRILQKANGTYDDLLKKYKIEPTALLSERDDRP
ncbi:adenosine deaminase [candidate division KSB1 bacterium]|nr:adenosine deaminase [candidate division KSB1 bacterium]